MICGDCRHVNPDGAKFCNECGGRLGEQEISRERHPRDYTPPHLVEKILGSKSTLEGERKQLTVLFADVKGSMELAEQTDPEEWHRILDRFFRILSEGVHRFEGTVNQYTGDGIMALFGAPIAHEDHAQRACYAALHMVDRLREYADEVRLTSGLSFTTRIGINSGEAVVGSIGDDLRMDYTAQGHAVGLAQRMEQLAESGSCYLTESTARLVEGYFELRSLGDATVKGVSQPIGVYALEGAGPIRSRFEASRSRGLSLFVGRTEEMAVLDAALEQAMTGHGQVVSVVADAGVGKSRLCFEFAERCRARGIRVTESQAVAHGATQPLRPVVELLRRVFEISADDRDEIVRRKVAGSLLLLDAAFRDDLELVFDVLGVSDPTTPALELEPQAHEAKVRDVVTRIFRLWGDGDQAVVILEDLHWMDQASEAILREIVEVLGGTSKLLLLNYRPEYQPDWIEASVPLRTISLSPLGAADVHMLLENFVGKEAGSGDLVALIERQTGGNPFFVEELVRKLVEDQVLVGREGAYRLEQPVTEIAVPPSVHATIASRIDRLDEPAKRALQAASVIGRTFSRALLCEICELDPERLDGALEQLVDRDFVDLQALYPDREYQFRHALTRDVAYSSPLSEFRTRTHRAVAVAIQRHHPDDLQVAGLVAQHLEQAGDDLDAARWHAQAGRWHRRRRLLVACEHWTAVRALLERCQNDAETAQLLLEAAFFELSVAVILGRSVEEVRVVLADGRAKAQEIGDLSAEIDLLNYYNIYLIGMNETGESLAAYEEAVGLTAKTSDLGMQLTALFALGMAQSQVGSIAAAGRSIDAGFALIGSSASDIDPGIQQNFAVMATIVRIHEGRLDDADESLRFARRLIEKYDMGYSTDSFASFVEYRRGRLELSLDLGIRAVEFAEREGLPMGLVLAHNALAQAQFGLERFAESEAGWRRSLEIARTQGVMANLAPLQLAYIAHALVGRGEVGKARSVVDEAVRTAVENRLSCHQCTARLALVDVLAAERDADSMEAEVNRIDRLAGEFECHTHFDPFLREERARIAWLRGDEALRRCELEEAVRLQETIGADGHVQRLRKMLEQ